jgi:hypothetical protein
MVVHCDHLAVISCVANQMYIKETAKPGVFVRILQTPNSMIQNFLQNKRRASEGQYRSSRTKLHSQHHAHESLDHSYLAFSVRSL